MPTKIKIHKCKNPVKFPKILYKDFPWYGIAISEICYDEKLKCWIADNGEYGSPVAFCPWCGEKLEIKGEREK